MKAQGQPNEKPDLAQVLTLYDTLVQGMEDSPEKRQARRALKTIAGSHYSSKWLTEILEKRSERTDPILIEARRIAENNLQLALDCLFDATSETQEGFGPFARLTLMYSCVDEILAALHLTQHAFVNQAYTHLRSVQEALDKAELFGLQPDLLELWASTDPRDKKKQLKELSPASVREKLGRERYDPVYEFFSEFGPHGSFRMAQTRTAMQLPEGERRKLHIWIGGCPFESNLVVCASFLVWTSTQYVCIVSELCKEKLNEKELTPRLYNVSTEYFSFLNAYFLPFVKREGIDTSSFVDFVESIPWLKRSLDDGPNKDA